VVQLARLVGLNTVVIDDREQFASRAHFPEPDAAPRQRLLHRLRAAQHHRELLPGDRHPRATATTSTSSERRSVPAPSYIGLIGSKAKIVRIFRALTPRGADPAKLRAVKAPIGLDIGCRTPEEIAVSIVAQLIAHRRRFYRKGNDPERDLDRDGNDIELPTPAEAQGRPPPLASADPSGHAAALHERLGA
jgi:xanthine dehydrogenase accessory factor